MNDNYDREKDWLGALLYMNGVRGINAFMSGSGDSGDVDEVEYLGENGEPLNSDLIDSVLTEFKLPKNSFPRWVGNAHALLMDVISRDGTTAGDWYNDAGGSVAAEYEVREDGMEAVTLDYTAGEYEYDEDYDEDLDDI